MIFFSPWKASPSLSSHIAKKHIGSWRTYRNAQNRICAYTSVHNRDLIVTRCLGQIEIQSGSLYCIFVYLVICTWAILPERTIVFNCILTSSDNVTDSVTWNISILTLLTLNKSHKVVSTRIRITLFLTPKIIQKFHNKWRYVSVLIDRSTVRSSLRTSLINQKNIHRPFFYRFTCLTLPHNHLNTTILRMIKWMNKRSECSQMINGKLKLEIFNTIECKYK